MAAKGARNSAIGPSGGGQTTKIHVIPDVIGRSFCVHANGRKCSRQPGRAKLACSPFCAGGRAVSLDVGGIDRRRAPDAAVPGQGLEQAKPDALPAPSVEEVVDGRVRPILGKAVAPARPAPRHVDDARDDPAVIDQCVPLRPRGGRGSAPTPHRSTKSVAVPSLTSPLAIKTWKQELAETTTLLGTDPSPDRTFVAGAGSTTPTLLRSARRSCCAQSRP